MSTDITPEHLRCGPGECPSVHALGDGRLLIIGAVGDHEAYLLGVKSSSEEHAIVVNADLLSDLPELTCLRAQVVELRNALQEICDSSAMGSAAACQAVAEEALQSNARRFRVAILTPQESPPQAEEASEVHSTPRRFRPPAVNLEAYRHMSNFARVAWHPKERVARVAHWLDNHFGHHQYGVSFDGDAHVYRPHEVEIPLDLVLVPKESLIVETRKSRPFDFSEEA